MSRKSARNKNHVADPARKEQCKLNRRQRMVRGADEARSTGNASVFSNRHTERAYNKTGEPQK